MTARPDEERPALYRRADLRQRQVERGIEADLGQFRQVAGHDAPGPMFDSRSAIPMPHLLLVFEPAQRSSFSVMPGARSRASDSSRENTRAVPAPEAFPRFQQVLEQDRPADQHAGKILAVARTRRSAPCPAEASSLSSDWKRLPRTLGRQERTPDGSAPCPDRAKRRSPGTAAGTSR